MKHTALAVGSAVCCVVLVAGCNANAADLPIPGSYVSGESYSIDIEFQSVLNLPDKAKVVVDGVDVGVLNSVTLVGSTALAEVDIEAAVTLPNDTVAELRQSTILGEIYISLLPPDGQSTGTGVLEDGDVIPLERTKPADNVEDVLRGLSNVVTGGHYVQLQEAVNNFNAAVPQDVVDMNKVNGAARAALTDLGDSTPEIDRILAAAEGVSNTIVQQQAGVNRILTLGPQRAAGLSEVLFSVVHLIFTLGYMTQNIGDVLESPYGELSDAVGILAPALVTVGSADSTVPMNVDKVNTLLRERLVPYFQSVPIIDVRSVSTDQGAATRADDMIAILRGIGIVK
ncbi:MAG: MlaD family protein [Rhodococcus sp. (in: high G+C Gram-positive bacteria)]